MADFPMISPLSDTELDAVSGGNPPSIHIRQNARGGDSVSFGGNGGAATASTGAALGGIGGASTAGAGGAGGTNTVSPSGVPASSERYKQDIHDMEDAGEKLMQLRPVTFRYKQAEEDGTKPLKYGLIAEEVAAVFPELVLHGRDGQPEAIDYFQLFAPLLAELQQQRELVQDQKERIHSLECVVADMRTRTDTALVRE
jgi:hypothetical protein